MDLARRPHEIGALRAALDRPGPGLIHVVGARGSGKSTVVRTALEGLPALVHRVPPLPEPRQRVALARAVAATLETAEAGEAPSTWDAVLERALAAARPGRPFALVLDDAHRLTESRSRVGAALARALAAARDAELPLQVILVGPAASLPQVALPTRGAMPPTPVLAPVEIRVPPLALRAALPFLPGSTPADRMRAYAVLGGVPAHLALVDPEASLWTNVRRLFLEAGAPLAERGLELLERDVQTPARYAAILSALASGETDWATVHQGVPDLTTSGQVAPYLRRLEELDLVETRRSLDAGPRSRNRRYRIVDPLLAFWFRFVLPFRHADGDVDAATWPAQVVRPAMDEHTAAVFPQICRDHMAFDAMEWAGANAREHGGLWGPGYDIDVAGMLASGAAFYGRCVWSAEEVDVDILAGLDTMVGETRYGFGREQRLRIVFAAGGFTADMTRTAARRHDVALVDGRALVAE